MIRAIDILLLDNTPYSIENGVLIKRNHPDICPMEFVTEKKNVSDFLRSVSSKRMRETIKKTRENSLVLFNDEDYEHNTEEDALISIESYVDDDFDFRTGNLIGFIKQANFTLNIDSRFGNSFLRYMIADVDGFLELQDWGGVGQTDGYDWLLAYIWNIKFKRAYHHLGLPKKYETQTDRTSKVRGNLDPLDFFQNINTGKFLCSYREHSHAIPATSLFIKAYDKIKHYNFCHGSRNIYNSFVAANNGVKRTIRELTKTRHFTNPLYSDYNTLIDLSKRILALEGDNFGSENESSAFLFDISMLFEYFIRKLLKRGGRRLLEKVGPANPKIPTCSISDKFSHRQIQPDIVFEANNGFYIFDVKYKLFDYEHGASREDLFQLHTYISQYANSGKTVKGCGFIYPMSLMEGESPDDFKSPDLISTSISQHSIIIPFHVIFLKIPNQSNAHQNDAQSKFSLMHLQCEIFLKAIDVAVSLAPTILGMSRCPRWLTIQSR